jgi:hypothetical protein
MQPFGDGLFVSCRCPAAPGVVVSDCPWCLLPPFWVRWQRAESIFAGGPAQGRRPRPLGWTAYDAAPSWGLWPCMARHEQHTAFIIFGDSLSHGMAWRWHDLPHHTALIYGLQSTQPRSSIYRRIGVIVKRSVHCQQARFRPVELVGRGKRTAR